MRRARSMTINALSPRLIPVPTQSQYPASGLSADAAGTEDLADSASEFTFLWRSHSLVGPLNFEDE